MLNESISKGPLGFQIAKFDNLKINYTITVSKLYTFCCKGTF